MFYFLSRAKLFVGLVGVAFWISNQLVQSGEPRQYAVEVSATVDENPSRINLTWPQDGAASGYQVYRKAPDSSSWNSIASLPGSATGYADSGISAGTVYEYQIQKSANLVYPGYGYITAAVRRSVVEDRGKLVLIVANTYAADLSAELSRLQQDLVGDGWTVLRHDVSPQDSVPSVKGLIKSDYDADPGRVKAVFMFGHVPIPYSGDFNPDGHPDHRGAWPADVYYGDMDGGWSDSSVNDGGADRAQNRNVPGDGKFDQTELPSDLELQVGRVDLSNMTCYANKVPSRSERDLLRQYLNKDHNFRHGQLNLERRGIVCDNFGERNGEAFAASGWRNFAPMFGANTTEVPYGQYFPTVNSQSFLWSYGTGGGGYWTCNGIGSSDDFANGDAKSVFTMFFGSYFGDWDNESNFLRAPLGSTTYGLTALWAGRPHCFVHHMGIGETIGYSTRLSQNNRNGGVYSIQNYGTHQAHIALMGDPSLRLHPVIPPGNLTRNGNTLTWSGSPDSSIQGYHVYRASTAAGPFTRVSGDSPLGQASFTDNSGGASDAYMVRAIKLERSGSGTYLNLSQGIFVGGGQSGGGGGGGTIPAKPGSVAVNVLSASQLKMVWTDGANNEGGFKIERRQGWGGTFQQVADIGANSTSFTDSGLAQNTLYFYRIRSYNSAGASDYSPEVNGTTLNGVTVIASASFIKLDTTTRGSWRGVYGAEGSTIIGDTQVNPNYAQISTEGQSQWTWVASTDNASALQKAGTATDRIAASWYSGSDFSVLLNLTDSQTHRVAFYCVDWGSTDRNQTIEVSDVGTGTVLNRQTASGFNGGQYFVWDLRGNVRIRFSRVAGVNAVVSGIFFGAVSIVSPVVASDPKLEPATRKFQLRISGAVGQAFVVEASTDFTVWAPISTNVLTSTSMEYVDSNASQFPRRFYRSRAIP